MIGALLLFAQIGAVQFETRVVPETVYVGQQVTYDAVTLIDDATRARLRANPEYTPADVSGVTVYDFPFDTASITNVIINGGQFRRYAYRRAFFPLTPGNYLVPPATLRYSVPESDGYSSQTRPASVQSAPDTFVALPLPTSGQPVGFTGAVGEFRDTIWTDGAAARMGDTFVVTVRVSGVGNLNLLPRPALQIAWASIVTGDERVVWDSTGSAVRGAKEFDWIVTPKVTGDMAVPPVRYDYFNPATHRYETATTALVPITVAAAGRPSVDTARQVRDTIGDSPFPVLIRAARANALAIAIFASALALVLIVALVIMRRRKQSDSDQE